MNKLTSLTGFGEGDPKPESFSKQVRIGKESKRIAKSAESKGLSAIGWRGDAKKYGHAAAKSKALSKKSGEGEYKNVKFTPTDKKESRLFDRTFRSKTI